MELHVVILALGTLCPHLLLPHGVCVKQCNLCDMVQLCIAVSCIAGEQEEAFPLRMKQAISQVTLAPPCS